MTEHIIAEERALPTPALNQARKAGKLPVEVYGHDQKNHHLFISRTAFEKIYRASGESSLVDLSLSSGESFKVLIQGVDKHPLTGQIIHADLLQVNMKEELHTSIPLVFIGESKAVRELGGTLVKSLEEVEVSCLPGDLIPNLEVDISVLVNLEDIIRVGDLKFPAGITVDLDLSAPVVAVAMQKVEEEKPVVEAPVAGAEGAVKDDKEKEGKTSESK